MTVCSRSRLGPPQRQKQPRMSATRNEDVGRRSASLRLPWATFCHGSPSEKFWKDLFLRRGYEDQIRRTRNFIVVFSLSMVTAWLAAALRSVADCNSLRAAEFRPSFVLLQYFGYLRRNPTDAPDNNDNGYQFWLAKLNTFNGDFVQAEMVKAFITSFEYRGRFGSP